MSTYIAVDFGAGSGRVIAGTVRKGKVRTKEIYRFPNKPVTSDGHLCWDLPTLISEMKHGITEAGRRYDDISGIGIDTWGVDFGLLGEHGEIIGNTVCYRDSRTQGMSGKIFEKIDRGAHYSVTGTQVMEINTLMQLYSMVLSGDKSLSDARRLLFMPDLFGYYLTGVAANEYTIASTSEMIDASSKSWSFALAGELGIPSRILGEIREPGTVLGRLKKELAEEMGIPQVDVISVASHDTACAVAAIPAEDAHPLFLSSGTWSLIGSVCDSPILSEEARASEFTNEGGFGGTICFLRNITGLWILQRLTAEWESRGEHYTPQELTELAAVSVTETVIEVDSPMFTNPPSMLRAINDYCTERHLAAPVSVGEYAYCVINSLATAYRTAFSQLRRITGNTSGSLHIIGGGSQNTLLNQLTADATGLTVIAGPVEATALGNILIQAFALGEISSMEELRGIAAASSEPQTYKPSL